MLQTICMSCKHGEHDSHTPVIQPNREGVLGGVGCKCQGECIDGRYIPKEFKGIIQYLKETMNDSSRAPASSKESS